MKILIPILVLLLLPFPVFSQQETSAHDEAAIRHQVRLSKSLRTAGIFLSAGGAAFTAVGTFIIVPTLGENGSHSVSQRTLGLSLVVGGLAVMMSGIIVIGRSGAKLRDLGSPAQGISIGISPEPNAPGVVLTYRL